MMHISDSLKLLIWPLAACISMGLLHGYAGLHVLRRGVIFVDLALAQMAALGAVVGKVVATESTKLASSGEVDAPAMERTVQTTTVDMDSPLDELDQAIRDTGRTSVPQAHHDDERGGAALLAFWPCAFALFGAMLLAFGRVPGERVPHEAIIGVVYVVAAAATVLILSKSPHGHEQMEEMLTGKLLFIDRDEVLSTGALYAVLGILHWVFRRPFIAISNSHDNARKGGLRVRLWDCLFYAMFALMVTRSVAVGGVLVVFSFLIIPGACAAMFVSDLKRQVLLAWLTASIVSVVGLTLSALGDLPTGSTVVATFGAALVLSIAASGLLRSRGFAK